MEKKMTMVERVAKAIYTKNANRSNNPNILSWGQIPPSHRQFWCECAAAGIEAMREPTHFMVEAGGEANYGWTREESIDRGRESSFDEHASNAKVLYQAVVDAAIKEQEKEG